MRPRTLILIGILILAAFLRFYLLHTTPPGLYPDEAMNGLNALRALDRSDFQVFYTDNNGREGLFIDLQALAIQIFGPSAWTLRAVSAAAGTLTIFVFYFLAREIGLLLYQREDRETQTLKDGTASFFSRSTVRAELFALLAAFLLAVSFWHINFSRIGFRAILLPLLSSAAFFFLLRGMRLRIWRDFFLSGFSLGLSLTTYVASRIVPLLFVPFFIWDWIVKRDRRFFFQWVVLGLGSILAFFPLGAYFLAHPADFFGRAGDVSVFKSNNPIGALLESTGKALLMFHLHGDGNWRHNVAGAPMLDPITGILFLIGLLIAVSVVVRHVNTSPRAPAACLFLFLWLGAGLLPEIATMEGIPHALRALEALPAIILLSALGGMWLIWDLSRMRLARTATAAITVSALMIILIMNFHQYFLVWAGNPNVQGAFRTDLSHIAEYVNQHQDNRRYVIINENGTLIDGVAMPAASIKYLTTDDPNIAYISPEHVRDIDPDFDHTIILPTQPLSDDLEAALRATFPSIERADENGIIIYRL